MFKNLNTLKLFFSEPNREFNVREIARIINKSPATVSKELKELETEKILQGRVERMLHLYKANIDSDKYRDMKVYYNIDSLRSSGLIQYLDNYYLKPKIMLFGSYSKGFDTETSDIDLVIISEKNTLPKLDVFEKKLKRTIQIFAIKDIKELKNPNLVNNVINGIVIQGEIKWI